MFLQQCVGCGKQFDQDQFLYTCPDCGDLKGTIDIIYDFTAIKNSFTKSSLKATVENSIFRYTPLLPINADQSIFSLKIGITPLFEAAGLAKEQDLSGLYIKDDSYNPSLSLKDRASAISLLRAKELGYQTVSTASTGNAAASLACLGAHLNMPVIIFVPESIPPPKLLQLQIYGASIILIKGNYDQAFDICREVCSAKDWYNRSTGINPFNLEGKKTVAFEICEQMDFDLPDIVFVPVGDGCIISGVWKGFKDFYQLGLVDRLPRLIACQAAGSPAVYNAFIDHKTEPGTVQAKTIADSISVDLPRDGVKALRALKESAGDAVLVSDQEILNAQQKLAAGQGIFCEPSAAAAYAGLLKYQELNKLNSTDRVLILLTGSGMKDLTAAEKGIKKQDHLIVDPDKDDIFERLKEL